MIRSSLVAIFGLTALTVAAPGQAESWTTVYEEEWVEQVPVTASRFVSPLQARVEHEALASYGPYRVIDAHTAALVGTTDGRSPAHLAAMLTAFPQIERLDFVEAPGTLDDLANLKMGRLLRARGISTSVSAGGSVRSGAVELFLAGSRRTIARGAEFAVHGWLDYDGRGAADYPAGSPEHQRYLDYYTEMGMTRDEAARFYAMTNSVPFEDALWLDGVEMAQWIGQEVADSPAPMLALPAVPHIARLDSGVPVQ